GGSAAGAGPEVADRQLCRLRLPRQPARGAGQSIGEQADVEAEMAREHINRFLLRSEKVEEQRGESCFAQRPCHEPIAGTVPAAAAAVRKKDHAPRTSGDIEIAFQGRTSRCHPDGLFRPASHRPFHEPPPFQTLRTGGRHFFSLSPPAHNCVTILSDSSGKTAISMPLLTSRGAVRIAVTAPAA